MFHKLHNYDGEEEDICMHICMQHNFQGHNYLCFIRKQNTERLHNKILLNIIFKFLLLDVFCISVCTQQMNGASSEKLCYYFKEDEF